jgi:hypothetical protein
MCPFIAAYMKRHREYDDLLKTPRHDDPPAPSGG